MRKYNQVFIRGMIGGLTLGTVYEVARPMREEDASPHVHHEQYDPLNAFGRYAIFSEVRSTTTSSAYSSFGEIKPL